MRRGILCVHRVGVFVFKWKLKGQFGQPAEGRRADPHKYARILRDVFGQMCAIFGQIDRNGAPKGPHKQKQQPESPTAALKILVLRLEGGKPPCEVEVEAKVEQCRWGLPREISLGACSGYFTGASCRRPLNLNLNLPLACPSLPHQHHPPSSAVLAAL